jgi:hypothetical protein
MVKPQLKTTRRRLLSQLLLVPVAATLSACGGGGDGGSSAGDASGGSALAGSGAASTAFSRKQPGLVAEPAQVADVIARGNLLSVGRVPGGGHQVVWQAGDDRTRAWSVWVQAYGADGQSSGEKTLLLSSTLAPEITGFGMSALVRRDASIAVAYVVERNADPDGSHRLDDVRTRLFAPDGTALGSEHVVQSVVAERLGTSPYYSVILSSTQMAQWDDGNYLVAWQAYPDVPHGAEHPDFNVRRVRSSGEPSGEVVDVGGRYAGMLRLTTLDDGSWLAETHNPVTPSAQQLYANIVQFDARHPLELPDGKAMPWQSFVLGLAQGGAVLFAGQFGQASNVVSPYSQWYNPAGKAAGRPAALPGIPELAIALEDGSYVGIRDEAQRFDKHGGALGTSFQVQGLRQIGDGLERQGMVLAWMQGNAVMTQRYLAP